MKNDWSIDSSSKRKRMDTNERNDTKKQFRSVRGKEKGVRQVLRVISAMRT